MNKQSALTRGWRGLVLVIVGVMLGASLFTPAAAHIGTTLSHLWSAPGHIRDKVKTYGDTRWAKKTTRVGYNYNNNGDANSLISLTGSGAAMTSVALNAPAAGFAYVSGKVEVFITHTNGTFDNVICKVSKTSGDVSTPSFGTGIVRVPAANPTSAASGYVDTIEINGVFSVVAGSNTFYLNCYESSTTGDDAVLAPEVTALYVSGRYGTGPAPGIATKGSSSSNKATG